MAVEKKLKIVAGAALAVVLALPGAAEKAEVFENPVIATDWPDPAIWRADGKFYSVATSLRTIRSSTDGISWTDTGIDPLSPSARQKLYSISKNLWAPCVVRLNGRWVLYISVFISTPDDRIVALTSDSPTGPFEFAAEVVNGPKLGIMNAIDPYVVRTEGRTWMFFGSCQDGIHRVELSADGLSMLPGASPVHVAGRRSPYGPDGKWIQIWGQPGTWEGSFLFQRQGWWYLFFSGGIYRDHTYHLMVGRSRSIDGVFVNREGEELTRGKASPILFSDQGDKFYGPGHNGEIIVAEDGRNFMFYHSHDTAFKPAERPTFLQELIWDADGWPTFDGGKPKRFERRFKAAGLSLPDESEAPLTWGGRPVHPAVVNPVTGSDPAWVISLRGEWQFSKPLKDLPNRNGIWGNFNARQEWAEARPMSVPSCWEAQGVGEPGPGVSWDPQWDECAKPIRHKYMGEGWYRRTVMIPASWKDRRVWLKVGGVKSVGWIWVNDVQVALVDSYCGTEKYEITDLVRPGEAAKIVVDVDNRKPSRKGLMSIVHRWGGIYRDIELEATPQVFVDDAWVRGDFDKRSVCVNVTVGGEVEKRGGGGQRNGSLSLRATVEGETIEIPLSYSTSISTSTSSLHLEVPLRNFRPWSPEHPNLYTAKVELVEGGRVVQTRLERFGVRKLEVCGKEFRLNGKPFYVRGFGDDFVYPLTGLSPADRDVHRAHLRRARAAGFNAVRLHTHCEVPEYFEAADELGLLIQVELPYYSDVPCEGFAFDPKRDVTELWRNYRRHPSFAVYSMGNEGSYGKVLDERLHRYVKAMDPDRLKINQDAHRLEINRPECADFAGGPTREWPRGTYDPDRPFVTHEYLNLCVKSDSRDEAKYVGAWLPPATRKSRGEWLAKFGLGLDWGDRLQDAQHALQGVWQKRGIEAARLDPFCDGYSFWTLVDVVVWNARANAYSAQGLFNPFWETKRGGRSPESFAAFNSPSCVLVDFCPTQSVFVAGESFRADVFLAHYGDDPLVDAKATWSLSVGGDALASGVVPVGDQPLGAVRKVASVPVTVPSVSRPSKAVFAVDVGGIRNSWDVWLFPKGPTLAEIRAKASRAGVVIAASGSPEAKAALAAGRPLVTVDGVGGAPNVSLGWWWMGAQVGTAIRPHRALGDFPHEGVLTPLWFRLLKKGAELPVPGIRPDDMIVVGEGGDKCYLYLCERTVGKSRVMECHGLDLLSDLPEGNCLLAALVEELARFD